MPSLLVSGPDNGGTRSSIGEEGGDQDTLEEEAGPNRAAQPLAAPQPAAPTCHLVSQRPKVQREGPRPHTHQLTLQLSWMTRAQDIAPLPGTGTSNTEPHAQVAVKCIPPFSKNKIQTEAKKGSIKKKIFFFFLNNPAAWQVHILLREGETPKFQMC